ncbi:MAG TPA: class I adenylate-forming enzyme family protein [Acidimicrobiales bacterium]|nr:class I adenylate-forming enzyme family protein [Acidimicrobiales bacterium]
MDRLLVADILYSTARRFPGRPGATLDDETRTFGQLGAATERLAANLAARGIRRGERVAWQGAITLDAIPLHFACAALGAVFVPVNPALGVAETRPLLELTEPALVLTDGEHPGDAVLADLLAETPGEPPPATAVDEDDPQVMFFTSGSTGRPKAVVLSQRCERLRSMVEALSYPVGATICMFPLFHMSGWTTALGCWLSGEHVVFVTRPDAEPLLEAIDRYRGAHFYAIPAVWRRILEVDRKPYDLSSLVDANTGTSATTPELLAAIGEAFPNTRTTITYGSTEAGLANRLGPEDLFAKPGSVGPPGVGVYCRLDDAGQLLVKSPYLMSGYFRNQEATAEALQDGWFHTGDLAECDDEGYYSIVGRVQDLIRSGGEYVAPVEVDAVVQDHPKVADGAVAGVPDPDWGEVVTAFVVVKPGQSLSLDGLRRHCDDRLAAYKVPRRLYIVDEIPRTGATMQVQRRRLVEWAAERDAPGGGGSARRAPR